MSYLLQVTRKHVLVMIATMSAASTALKRSDVLNWYLNMNWRTRTAATIATIYITMILRLQSCAIQQGVLPIGTIPNVFVVRIISITQTRLVVSSVNVKLLVIGQLIIVFVINHFRPAVHVQITSIN